MTKSIINIPLILTIVCMNGLVFGQSTNTDPIVQHKDFLIEDKNVDVSPFEIPVDSKISENFQNTELAQLYGVLVKKSTTLETTLNLQDDEVRILEAQKSLLKENKDKNENANNEIDEVSIELRNLKTEYDITSEELNQVNKLIDKIDNSREKPQRWEKLTNESEAFLFRKAKTDKVDITKSPYYFETNSEITHNAPCNVIFDGFDQEINKKRKETEPSFFFSYTHPKLKPHFKEKNFIECKGSIAKIEGTYYLQLSLKLASKDASRNYGQIERNSLIRLQMINGEKRYLSNIYPDAGLIEQYTGNTIYQAIFPIDKDFIKLFKSVELDHLGIIWTTGYEQYDIYEVDFLMNHLNCIDGE